MGKGLKTRTRQMSGAAFILFLAIPFILMDWISDWPKPIVIVLKWLIARLAVMLLLGCGICLVLLVSLLR